MSVPGSNSHKVVEGSHTLQTKGTTSRKQNQGYRLMLLDEPPLIVQPTVAVTLGLHEAIILQQINYWLQSPNPEVGKIVDGRRWIYNSYRQWHEKQFPFLSLKQIRTAIGHLEAMGVLLCGNFCSSRGDRTKWYSINRGVFDSLQVPPYALQGTWSAPQGKSTLAPQGTSLSETTSEITQLQTAVVVEDGFQDYLIDAWGDKGRVSRMILQDFAGLASKYTWPQVKDAIRIAAEAGQMSLRYVRGVLRKQHPGSVCPGCGRKGVKLQDGLCFQCQYSIDFPRAGKAVKVGDELEKILPFTRGAADGG